MNWKKAALGLMAGLVSAALFTGCGGGGGSKGGDIILACANETKFYILDLK